MTRVITIELKVRVDDRYEHQDDAIKILDCMEDRYSSKYFVDAKIVENKPE